MFSHSNTFPSMSRVFQTYPVICIYFEPIPATLFFWNDWLWVCVSEAVCLQGCFPLEPIAFSSLTVSYCYWCHLLGMLQLWLLLIPPLITFSTVTIFANVSTVHTVNSATALVKTLVLLPPLTYVSYVTYDATVTMAPSSTVTTFISVNFLDDFHFCHICY